ncbi:MAG: MarR family transcriptional regulator [Clostridia bacterium]|nr:MarR family transcriptional regulator [Clostridia bacterium]
MTKRWQNDAELLDSVSSHLLGVMSMFPKRLLRVDELIHRYSMPLSQMQILAMVETETLSIGQISTRMGIAKPNITPLVDALIARGFVRRIRNGEDRRVVRVELMPEGKECLGGIRGAIAEQIRRWPEGLTRREIERLDGRLADILDLMNLIGES